MELKFDFSTRSLKVTSSHELPCEKSMNKKLGKINSRIEMQNEKKTRFFNSFQLFNDEKIFVKANNFHNVIRKKAKKLNVAFTWSGDSADIEIIAVINFEMFLGNGTLRFAGSVDRGKKILRIDFVMNSLISGNAYAG